MKRKSNKLLMIVAGLASVFSCFTLTSCNPGTGAGSKDIFEINTVNWDNYCSVTGYFLGVQDGVIRATCWFDVDTNYEIYEPIEVTLTLTFDTFYYPGLLGGEEQHQDKVYWYSGTVADHKEQLDVHYEVPYTGTKEYFSRGEPIVSIKRISGKLCR